ncbi:MAG: DUF5076 domain-containing protein, partial [Pseudomonadota bacterium]
MFGRKKTKETRIENPMLIAMRVENAEGTLVVHLDSKQLGNPGEAGVMLADIGRHMARALATTSYEGSEDQALTELVTIFNA